MIYDIVIIGSGAGGGTLVHALAATGKNILLIERGGFLPREKENWNAAEVFLKSRYKTKEVWHDGKGNPIHPGTCYYVGGNTKVYGAALFRLREKDFEEVQHEGGVSPSWPIKYQDLQPYYLAAEKLYHVHGQRGADPMEPPEEAAFPYKAVSHEPRIQKIADGMKSLGLNPFPIPLGLRINEERKEKSACIRCDTCDGFPCLVDAKSDAEISCINPALEFSNVTLITNSKAVFLETDESGKRVISVKVERDGKEESYSADTYVLSCGAINSAALLLRSKSNKHPNGLANSSGLVGRNYMCHINSVVLSLSKNLNLTRYQKTLALNDFYFNAPDSKYPLGHIQLLGNIKKEMLKGGAPFFVPDVILNSVANHTVGWWASSEDLPSYDNRVSLDAEGGIVLQYEPNNEGGHKKLVKKLKEIVKTLDGGVAFSDRIPIGGVAHQVGTCRFGIDPKTSVLDVNCKAHDLDNLYLVDGSFFPSSGAMNPALTIIANALRVAEVLKKKMS